MPKREQIQEMLKSDPDDVFLRYALAMTYASEGDSAAALEGLQEVIERDPDYVAAFFQKGQIFAREGRTEAAREILVRGIEAARRARDSHAEAEMIGFLETLQ